MSDSLSGRLSDPQLTWRDGQPISQQFNDPYFSIDNGLAESRYVFLQHNDIPQRWLQWPWLEHPTFNIIETGFGTGLNFLATWAQWREHLKQQTNQGWLHFSSIEKFPLNRSQLLQALALWPELAELALLLNQKYPEPIAGTHHLVWPKERLSLTLWFNDVAQALPQISSPVHAWYLDGFAPARNPEMWQPDLFRHMRRLSQTSTFQHPVLYPTIATFTAAGLVRRGLQGAGFNIRKHSGFGRKREMLAGVYQFTHGPEQPDHYWQKPWLHRDYQRQSLEVIVVGAGLAGCFSARSLAERGVKVKVIDPKGIAKAASSNPQGGVYIKLSASDSAINSEFHLSAYHYALRCFKHYLGEGDTNNPIWQQCGLLQLAFNKKEQQRQQKLVQKYHSSSELFQAISAEEAGSLAGTELADGGLFFSSSGWASPPLLCQTLLNHPNIEFIQQKVEKLSSMERHWQLLLDNSITLQADHVILATATESSQLLPDNYLPTQRVRGQISYLDARQAPPLNIVLSGQCYLTPAQNNQLCLGATFDLQEQNPDLLAEDHLSNLHNFKSLGSPWETISEQGLTAVMGGNVGFRCATSDYLPMVGAVIKDVEFLQTFKALSKDSKAQITQPCPTQSGLWLNIGHGSKGLVTTPICAELLACQITQAALPLSLDISEALWPGRFLLRDLARRKIK